MTVFWIGLIATVVVGVGTYVARASFIVALANRQLPEPLRVALGFVAPAVLAALVVSLLFGSQGSGPGVPEISALVVAAIVGWRTRSLVAVLGLGMGVFWLVTWLV